MQNGCAYQGSVYTVSSDQPAGWFSAALDFSQEGAILVCEACYKPAPAQVDQQAAHAAASALAQLTIWAMDGSGITAEAGGQVWTGEGRAEGLLKWTSSEGLQMELSPQAIRWHFAITGNAGSLQKVLPGVCWLWPTLPVTYARPSLTTFVAIRLQSALSDSASHPAASGSFRSTDFGPTGKMLC